jgi:hypothetical protein
MVWNEEESEATNDLSNPNNWPLGKVVAERGFTTDTNGAAKLSFKLGLGEYRAILETQDRFGRKVTGKLPLQVLRPGDDRLAIRFQICSQRQIGKPSRATISWLCGARATAPGGRSSKSNTGTR